MLFRDRVAQVTNTSGTGDISLDGTVEGGFLTFASQVPADNPDMVFAVLVKDGDAFEVFESTLQSAVPGGNPTLKRGRVIRSSSIGNDRVDLSNAVNKPVYMVEAAETWGPLGGTARWALTTTEDEDPTVKNYKAAFGTPAPDLQEGARFQITIHAANSDADVTLTVDDNASKPLRAGRPLRKIAAGRLVEGAKHDVEYSAADEAFVVLTPLPRVTKEVADATYTVLEEDHQCRLVFTNAAGCAVTLPEATGQFAAPFEFEYLCAVPVTFTPTTSTINGAASLTGGAQGRIWADGGNYRGTAHGIEAVIIPITTEAGAVSAGTGKVAFYLPYKFVVTEVRASLNVAQASGSILTVDINANATSILSTKLTIDNTETVSTTAAAAPVISTAVLSDGAFVSFDVDQIGNGSAKGLKVTLIGFRA
jgi:hypothetical protein